MTTGRVLQEDLGTIKLLQGVTMEEQVGRVLS